MARKKNRNILLIKGIQELGNEVNYTNFMYKDHFIHLCDLIPNKSEEKLDIEFYQSEEQNLTKGLIYIFVIRDKIFKIGQTIGSIGNRVSSYNCGKVEYRISGTNSTTNYFVLQSFLNLNETINVYAYFATKQRYEVFGEIGDDCFPSVKVIEKKIIKDFVDRYNKKPIGNTQR